MWSPFDTAIFDCDSTLSAIEGIDELAANLGLADQIRSLTDQAMGGEISLEAVYGIRLEMMRPSRNQVFELRQAYKTATVPHAKELVTCLSEIEVTPWIVSGGLADAVIEYGIWLGFEPERIKAVASHFDKFSPGWWQRGSIDEFYSGFQEGELTRSVGKGDVIRKWIKQSKRRIHFGDGASDMAASADVELFVGYTGVVDRKAVSALAPVLITSESLAPALCLILGPQVVSQMVGGEHGELCQASLDLCAKGSVVFNDRNLEAAFDSSLSMALN